MTITLHAWQIFAAVYLVAAYLLMSGPAPSGMFRLPSGRDVLGALLAIGNTCAAVGYYLAVFVR